MKRTTVNYWVDLVVGAGFVVSAISGLVFLLPADLSTGILGISYQVWNSVHTWSSLAMIAGAGAHLAPHRKWMVSMTRRMLSPTRRQKAPNTRPEPAPAGVDGIPLSRRAFLAAAGTTAAVAGLLGVATAILDTDLAGASAADQADTVLVEAGSTEQESTDLAEASTTMRGANVACPRGLVDDPYPGRCHHYVDTNGDGFRDYSAPA